MSHREVFSGIFTLLEEEAFVYLSNAIYAIIYRSKLRLQHFICY